MKVAESIWKGGGVSMRDILMEWKESDDGMKNSLDYPGSFS